MPDPKQPQVPRPDIIEPQAPPENPVRQTPSEQPMVQPDEFGPVEPDQIQPETLPSEVPEFPGN